MKQKSSKCSGSNCVEVDRVSNHDKVIVFDLFGNRCVYTFDEWRAFIAGVKNSEFDV